MQKPTNQSVNPAINRSQKITTCHNCSISRM
jgi:hypothetical protein